MSVRAPAYRAVQPREARSANSAAILRLLLARGSMSRSDLAELTGLSQGTVTRIVTDLMERGFLDEVATRTPISGLGRPHILLAPSRRAGLVLGAHIGVDYLHLGLIGLDGQLVETAGDIPHDNTVEGAIGAIFAGLRSLSAAAAPFGATVVTNGWVDSDQGLVRNHPGLQGWESVPLAGLLSERLGFPVSIDSSVRASAVADLLFGHSGEFRNFIHVFLGNVTGISMVMNRRVVEPANGGGGLLVDWPVSDRNGVLAPAQALLTQRSMIQRARDAGVIAPAEGLLELLESIHPVAGEILEDRAAAIASLLRGLNELVAPEVVFVTSSLELIDHDQLGGSRLSPAPGTQSEMGPEIRYVDSQSHTLRAAAASFIERFLRDPIAYSGSPV